MLNWAERPYSLVSWWDMREFPIDKLLMIVRGFQNAVSDPSRESDNSYSGDQKQSTLDGIKSMREECENCLLPSVADQFQRIYDLVEEGCSAAQVTELFPEVMNRIEDECRRHYVMLIEPEHVKYCDAQCFDSTDLSVNKVSVQFPNAAEDIAEAGKCLACARSTACVMHLIRVVEVGLEALAKELRVGPKNDWGKYLSGIEAELTARLKTSGARTPDEQFYAEAHAMFDSVRRAWRNPTMHVDKTYTEERAEEILIAVRSFMRHLATRLHD